MTKRTNATAQQSKVKVNKNNQNGGIRILRVKKGDSLKKIYAKYRKAFTAADLQKYAEIEEGIPFEEIIAEIDLSQREWEEKKKKQYKK
jgi:hypothetical protein